MDYRKIRGYPRVKVLLVDIAEYRSSVQIVIMTTVISGFFIISGAVQEKMSRMYRKEFLDYNWYLTLIQLGCFSLFGAFERMLTGGQRRLPWKNAAGLAFLTVVSYGFGNLSLSYINFPTQVLFNTSKHILVTPGALIYGKRTNFKEILSALLMVFGLIVFVFTDIQVSPTFNIYGVLAMLLVLFVDVPLGNMHQQAFLQYESSNAEMVMCSCSLGFVYLLTALTVSHTLIPAYEFCGLHPIETYGLIWISSLCGFLGNNVLLLLTKSYGSTLSLTVVSCRKAITITLSFLLFPKPFVIQYFWSGLLFFFGIFWNIGYKNQKRNNPSEILPLDRSVQIKPLLPRRT